MKYVSNVLLAIEQPAHKIPILIDYDAVPVHAPQRVTVHKGSNPSRRLVANSRLNVLPAKPGRVITDHTFVFKSVSPWSAEFPQTKVPEPSSKVLKAYNPDLIHTAKFRKVIQRPVPKLFEIEDSSVFSVSPFDERFPLPSQMKRKSRNRSQRRRRHLEQAMKKYKAETGSMYDRPVGPEVHPDRKNIKSFSPWQEAEFANACNIPAFKFMKKFPAVQHYSFSPWSEKFPVFKAAPKVSLPVAPPRPTATPFPAFSPLHKRAKASPRNSVTPSTSAMDMVEAYEAMAGLMHTH